MKKLFLVIIILLFTSPSLFGVIFIAHRCAPKLHGTENSLDALKEILHLREKTGFPHAIEFDVRASKDDYPVVMHDEVTDRTTTENKTVRDLSLEELAKIKLTDGQKIPLLSEILDTINRKTMACIEIKSQEAVRPTIETIAQYVSQKGWLEREFVIISFQALHLETFSKLCPTIKTGLLLETQASEDDISRAKKINAQYLIVWKDFLTQELIACLHQNNLGVIAYILDDPLEMKKLIDWGIDGIASDDPRIFGLI